MEVGASLASRVMDRQIVLLLAASVAVSCGASDETEPVAEAAAATGSGAVGSLRLSGGNQV